jgi:hypothetical protein
MDFDAASDATLFSLEVPKTGNDTWPDYKVH